MSAERELRWVLGASSSLIPHEGLPVVLTGDDQQRVWDDLQRCGALHCRIKGQLRFIRYDHTHECGYALGIPQMCLEVGRVEPATAPEIVFPRVSVVVTFIGDDPQRGGLQASFVTFEAGRTGSLEEAVQWLDEEVHDGRIVTDFDQQMTRFGTATFSLERLLESAVEESAADGVLHTAGVNKWDRNQLLMLLRQGSLVAKGAAARIGERGGSDERVPSN